MEQDRNNEDNPETTKGGAIQKELDQIYDLEGNKPLPKSKRGHFESKNQSMSVLSDKLQPQLATKNQIEVSSKERDRRGMGSVGAQDQIEKH